LTVAREHLQALNERREQDAAALSHDIRSPLNAIELQARGLERLATAGGLNPDVVRDRAGAIRRTVRVLLSLVTNVLDGVRLEAGKLELSREPVSLVDVAKQVVEMLQPVAEHAGVRLALRDGVPAQVVGDRVRLFQTLQNLADNAVRFSPKGETVTLALEAADGKVRCRVMDRGPGVPAEDRERVFDRHFQGGRRKGVAGLGLSIARQLVELHGGRLWVEEAPGGGACFVLELPADATAPSA
ncbi:MAG TPA: HAMP domain-containing sensor histidine kinase, partial [Myxococcaceae bacterium]|nr:HAMP domain-containing sensor histidine kinase [Myxococcaceae bacterium]